LELDFIVKVFIPFDKGQRCNGILGKIKKKKRVRYLHTASCKLNPVFVSYRPAASPTLPVTAEPLSA
jgi:hypothetical protein